VEARRLLSGTSFGPEAMAAIGKVFDQIWTEVAHHFPSPLSAEAVRVTLANALLTNVGIGGRPLVGRPSPAPAAGAGFPSRDVGELVEIGRKALAASYRWGF
jgi:hypothetical protein